MNETGSTGLFDALKNASKAEYGPAAWPETPTTGRLRQAKQGPERGNA